MYGDFCDLFDILCCVFTTLHFVLDLMVCGSLNDNISPGELMLYSAVPLAAAVRLSWALSLASLREKVCFFDLQAAVCH